MNSESTDPISSEQIDRFQADLRAAVIAGVPLKFSHRGGPADEADLERLGRLAHHRAAPGLTAEALSEEDLELPSRYRAALALWVHGENMPLVLDGLTADAQVERTLSRSLRGSLLYFSLVLVVGYLGLLTFALFTAPRIDAMHRDLALTPQGAAPAGSELTVALTWALVIIPVVAVAAAGVLRWAGGSGVIAGRWFGRGHYRTYAAASTAADVARVLIAHGVPATRAVEWASELVGGSSREGEEISGAITVHDRDGPSSAGLVTLADQCRMAAAHRLATLSMLAPILLVVVLGGAVALAFATSVFGPVVALYKDLIPIGGLNGGTP